MCNWIDAWACYDARSSPGVSHQPDSVCCAFALQGSQHLIDDRTPNVLDFIASLRTMFLNRLLANHWKERVERRVERRVSHNLMRRGVIREEHLWVTSGSFGWTQPFTHCPLLAGSYVKFLRKITLFSSTRWSHWRNSADKHCQESASVYLISKSKAASLAAHSCLVAPSLAECRWHNGLLSAHLCPNRYLWNLPT